MGIQRFFAKRLMWLVFVLAGLAVITFFVSFMVPADPARYFAGPHATNEQVEALKRRYGLDRPPHEQFVNYIIRLFHADLGMALHTRRPVIEDLKVRFPATLELALVSIVIATLVGVLVGVVSAVKKDTLIDNVMRVFALGGVALPGFFLALVFQFVFYARLGIFPSGGRIDPHVHLQRITGLNLIDSTITLNWPAFVSSFYYLILPSTCLAYIALSTIARMTRSSMLEVLSQDYMKTAKAKGLANFKVIYKHALRNALIPTSTVIGLTFGNILGGAVLIELIFRWPGVGTYLAQSMITVDFPAIMGTTLLIAAIYVIVNLFVDIGYSIIDPRISVEK
jgi:peptide/nickel transport system permease protein